MTMTAPTSTTPSPATSPAPATAGTTGTDAAPARSGPSLLRHGGLAVLAAAVATMLVGAVAGAIDVPLAIEGEEIPVFGFAFATVVCGAVGLLLAAVIRRWAPAPRATFTWAAVALLALSFVPSVTADTDTATKVVLVTTHLVAAAIVVPVVTRTLPTRRTRA